MDVHDIGAKFSYLPAHCSPCEWVVTDKQRYFKLIPKSRDVSITSDENPYFMPSIAQHFALLANNNVFASTRFIIIVNQENFHCIPASSDRPSPLLSRKPPPLLRNGAVMISVGSIARGTDRLIFQPTLFRPDLIVPGGVPRRWSARRVSTT